MLSRPRYRLVEWEHAHAIADHAQANQRWRDALKRGDGSDTPALAELERAAERVERAVRALHELPRAWIDRSEPWPKAVIFDLFGTLIEFGVAHHPFRKLLGAVGHARSLEAAGARRLLMTRPLGLRAAAEALGGESFAEICPQLEMELEEELSQLHLFPEVEQSFHELHDRGIAIGICSNLAMPYGRALSLMPADFVAAVALSYEVGAVKPELAIFDAMLDRLKVQAHDALFIGDSMVCDVEGPRAAGIAARHLDRAAGESLASVLGSVLAGGDTAK